MTTTITAQKVVPVVGLTFVQQYPTNLHLLSEIVAALPTEQLPVVLRRNPDNPHDANAVEVHIPALGDMAFVGHVSREVAARLAPGIDKGQRFLAHVYWVRIHPDKPEQPGLDIAIARVVEGDRP
jgi:hypothetical protein